MKVSEILMSAARELCTYIDNANQKVRAQHSDPMQPPDLSDHQTCHELELAAKHYDKLEADNAALVDCVELAIPLLVMWNENHGDNDDVASSNLAELSRKILTKVKGDL